MVRKLDLAGVEDSDAIKHGDLQSVLPGSLSQVPCLFRDNQGDMLVRHAHQLHEQSVLE